MKKYTTEHLNYGSCTVDGNKLRNLCIAENYFTSGCNEAYDRLFRLNEMGKSIETLAACIWMNSPMTDLHEIEEQIQNLNRWPIYIESLSNALLDVGFGETEIEIIVEAIRTHQDAGEAYKVIE